MIFRVMFFHTPSILVLSLLTSPSCYFAAFFHWENSSTQKRSSAHFLTMYRADPSTSKHLLMPGFVCFNCGWTAYSPAVGPSVCTCPITRCLFWNASRAVLPAAFTSWSFCSLLDHSPSGCYYFSHLKSKNKPVLTSLLAPIITSFSAKILENF